jgi:hypothetical protein
MARWEHRCLGRDQFPELLSQLEIEQFFTLEAAELAAVRRRRRPINRLGVSLQIGFVKMTGAPGGFVPRYTLREDGVDYHLFRFDECQ